MPDIQARQDRRVPIGVVDCQRIFGKKTIRAEFIRALESDSALNVGSRNEITQRLRRRYRLAAVLGRVHRFFYIMLNGQLVSRRGHARFLLLTTKGRRSDRERTVVLLYVSDNENKAVIASFGGNSQAPAWLLNVRNNPKVKIQMGRSRWEGIARIVSDEERSELWPRFVEIYRGYERYQAHTTRRFPIVVITPARD